jgi:hypothetical protein
MEQERMELEVDLNNISISISGYFSSPEFAFPLENNSTNPNFFFEFISELLYTPIPIAVEGAKFGPGEIIVNGDNIKAARRELGHCIIELQKFLRSNVRVLIRMRLIGFHKRGK